MELLIGYDRMVINTTDMSHLINAPSDTDPLESKPAVQEDTIVTLVTTDVSIIDQLSQILDTVQ